MLAGEVSIPPVWPGLVVAGPGFVVLLILPMQMMIVVRESPLLLLIVAAAIGIAIVVMVRWARNANDVQVNRDLRKVRAGRREVDWAAITRAELFAAPVWAGTDRTLILILRDDARFHARVHLRHKGALTLTQSETDALSDLIDGSEIAMPHDRDDPNGRFSKSLYPANLTKTEAAELAATPPGADDALPIPVG